MQLPLNTRIHLYSESVDMRKSFDGLSAIVRNVFQMQPLSGEMFVFLNHRRDFMKILWWDVGGFCLLLKRLEQGRFKLPEMRLESVNNVLEVDRAVLTMIFDGIEVNQIKRLKRYVPPL